ncbi:MAG: hypothetical protein DME02_13660 [Candidatus Rokuibacteriota bacterium]|nr:MAG: hypothetical protein DME02_13660 [Candidatus Rokubacteria bacterium]
MSSGVELLVPSGKLSDLIARSQMNIQRSQALVAAADALVRVAQRSRWPRFAGGTDGSEPRLSVDPRVLRTWTKVKNGALPTDGARRRWVGPGRGETCNGCGDGITPDETEYEIDFSNALLLRFHRECLRTWETFDGARRQG